MPSIPNIVLNNGITIPQFGFGVFQVPPPETCEITRMAINVGYRHIDTAEMYRNEKEVGEAIRESGIPRGDLFITSKLSNAYHAYDDALRAFDQTLVELDTDYLDLFLIHWPLPAAGDFVETWRAMEAISRSGGCRAIGVSNFHIPHLQRVLTETEIVPAINQIEVSPYIVQDELRAFCKEHGIAVEAWSPIARGKAVNDPVIGAIAERVGKTAAQVTLRWHIQRGDIVFPKSMHRERMVENIDTFDFELTDDDMAAITSLNRNERIGPNPDEFNMIPKA